MDTDYLKQTVGPLLSSALSALVIHGYSSKTHAASGGALHPRGVDPVTFVGEYLLHHDQARTQVTADASRRKGLVDLREAVAKADRTEKEHRRRFEDEVRSRAQSILEKEAMAEEEAARASAAAAALAEQREKELASSAAVVEEGKEEGENGNTELRRGVPEAIEEGEEDEKEEEPAKEETTAPGSAEEQDGGAAPTIPTEGIDGAAEPAVDHPAEGQTAVETPADAAGEDQEKAPEEPAADT
ncbi:hypothetical protein HKX48_008496 [Thoreauomyces humboldtii]|nr:hypothetical protein HKX48_008496 [Thoreauomyces humboldtii]